MDQESMRALDDVNVGDEVEVRYLSRPVDGSPRRIKSLAGAYRATQRMVVSESHSYVRIAGAGSIRVDAICTFRIRRRAEVKRDG